MLKYKISIIQESAHGYKLTKSNNHKGMILGIEDQIGCAVINTIGEDGWEYDYHEVVCYPFHLPSQVSNKVLHSISQYRFKVCEVYRFTRWDDFIRFIYNITLPTGKLNL